MSPSRLRGRTVPLMLGATAALLLATACADGDDEPATTSSSITMENFAFSPANPEVRPGEKITVANKDSAAHTVTATEGDAFDTGNISGGDSGTFTAPSQAGRYGFVCTLHPNMTGTLVVR
ncbi:hypothetical protein GCM10018777_11280 [Streptomyces albogriseolus]|nr:hypothetical protein GCM10018777_11280 [Streptomyces viridodiastaticus]